MIESRLHLALLAAVLLSGPPAWAQDATDSPSEAKAEKKSDTNQADGAKPESPESEEPAEEKKDDAKKAAPTTDKTKSDPQPATAEAEQSKADTPVSSGDAEIDDIVREYESFEAEIKEYRSDVKRLIEHEYKRRRRSIQARYSKLLSELMRKERARRTAAIERFEAFLAKYPGNRRYTPDALFRLAELHFEKANDEYVTRLEEFDELSAAFDEGKLAEEPEEPRQNYGRTIELFDRLIGSWPQYRDIDGAYYLKGYCLSEMEREEDALASFKEMVKRFPKSRFAPETWTRIGEYYFDSNQLAEAIASYKRVLEFTDSPYYDKALYKLAWTYYRNDQYDAAITHFRQLIEFSDAQAKKTGRAGSDLRSEAIQYLAVSLQEEDWDGDGEPDPGAGFERVMRYVRGDRSYDVEVLRALAEIFFDNAKYEETVATIRHLLDAFPANEENPKLHARMITAYERLQRFEDAFGERAQLAKAYGKGTVWYENNRHRPEALRDAEEKMEDALIQAATYHHSRAQQLKAKLAAGEAASEADAIREYELAAAAYEGYLSKYPNSENAYALNFFYAECLYYSSLFERASKQYAKVRDSKQGTKYRESAAFFAILSREMDVRGKIGSGQLEARSSLTDVEPTEAEKTVTKDEEAEEGLVTVEPEEIPDAVKALLTERKRYVELGLNSTEDKARLPRIVYKLGEVYFDFLHFEEARKWFAWLIKRYPGEKVTTYAAGNIIETYRRTNNWKKMAEWAEIIAKAGLGREFDEEIRTLKVGALFKEAERLYESEQFEDAAREYIRLVTENPGNRFADRALNNAAVAYEKTRKFESATRAYEKVYTDYPESQYVEEALFRVGVNAERFYNFDKSIKTHLRLVKQFPNSTHRADSLFKAALLQERTQQYRKAATNFERYAQLFPTRKDTAETYFRAGKMYEKLKDTRNQIRVYERFAIEFGNDPEQNVRVVTGLARIAEIRQAKGERRKSRQALQRVIDEFNLRGMQPGSFESRYPARSAFELVEIDFARYQVLKLAGSLKNQGRIIKDMQRWVKELERRYADVLQFKSAEWNLASLFRLGHIYQLFAEALYDAPIPGSLNIDEEDVYRTTLEDVALPVEDEAVKRYEAAFVKAREFKITNEWTKRILKSLNKYKPSEYPLFKEEKRMAAKQQLTAPRLLNLFPQAPREAPTEEVPASEDTPEPSADGGQAETAAEPAGTGGSQ